MNTENETPEDEGEEKVPAPEGEAKEPAPSREPENVECMIERGRQMGF